MEDATVIRVSPDRFGYKIRFSDRTSFYIDSVYCSDKSDLPKFGDKRSDIVPFWNEFHFHYFSGKKSPFITLHTRLRAVMIQNKMQDEILDKYEVLELGKLIAKTYREETKEVKIPQVHGEVIERNGANVYPRDFTKKMDSVIEDFLKAHSEK